MISVLLAASCGGSHVSSSVSGAPGSVEVASSPAVQDLYRLASDFYARLEGRRFNSLLTFRDPTLRQYFRSGKAFSDYYADLAQSLNDAHFAASRPLETEVEEFLVEEPGRARVRVRLLGESALPLRWWTTELLREDRWERLDGRWWLIPGRL